MRDDISLSWLHLACFIVLAFMPNATIAGECLSPPLGDSMTIYADAVRHLETELPHVGLAVALNWSADSRYLGLGTQYGTRLLMWDAQTKVVLEAHRTGAVYSGSIGVLSHPPRLIFESDAAHGKSTVAGPMSDSLSVWDMVTGHETTRIVGPDGYDPFDVSGESTTLVATRGIINPTASVYDVKTGKLKFSVSLPASVHSIKCWDDCQSWVAGSFDGDLFEYRSEKRSIVSIDSPFHKNLAEGGEVSSVIYAIAPSQDGSRIAVGIGTVWKGLRRGSGRELDRRFDDQAAETVINAMPAIAIIDQQSTNGLRLPAHECGYLSLNKIPIQSLSWDFKRKILLIVTSFDEISVLASSMSRTSVETISLNDRVHLVSVSPDGAHLAVALADDVKIYSLGQ